MGWRWWSNDVYQDPPDILFLCFVFTLILLLLPGCQATAQSGPRGISCLELVLYGILRAHIIIDPFRACMEATFHALTTHRKAHNFACLEVCCYGIDLRPWRQHSKVQPMRAQDLDNLDQ